MSDIVVQKGVVTAAPNGSKFLKSVVKKQTGLKTKRGSAMQVDGGGSTKKTLSKTSAALTPEQKAAAQAARIAKWAAKNAKKKQARKLFKLNAPAKMQVEAATPAAVVSPQAAAKAAPKVKKPQERRPAWPTKVKKAKKAEVGKEAVRAKGVAAAKVAAAVAAARANAGAASTVPSGATPAPVGATATAATGAATPAPVGAATAAAGATGVAAPVPKGAAPVWGAAAPGKELTKAERRKQNQRAFKLQRIAFAKSQNGGGRCSGGSGKR